MHLNKIMLAGNLTKDVELRYTQQGMAIANFSIAVNKGKKDNQKTFFANCVAFKETAENLSKYVVKGNNIYVEGEIETQEWTDKEGNKKSKDVIVCNVVKYITMKPREEQAQQPKEDIDFAGAGNYDNKPYPGEEEMY